MLKAFASILFLATYHMGLGYMRTLTNCAPLSAELMIVRVSWMSITFALAPLTSLRVGFLRILSTSHNRVTIQF